MGHTTAERVSQLVHPVDKARKRELLSHRIGKENWRQVLVFTRTKHGANRLATQLEEELASARARIDELERMADAGQTQIEPVDQEALGDELDASNDPTSVTQTGLEEALDEDASAERADAMAETDEPAVAGDELVEESVDEFDEELVAELDVEPVDEPVAELADEPADEAADEAVDELADEADDELEDQPGEAWDDYEEGDEPLAMTADVTELHDPEPGGLRDNLRMIKGIGPAIEKTLNELGIFRYHQIAEMTEYDIDRVAQRLKGFSSRIYREDWIGQARELQLKKSGT